MRPQLWDYTFTKIDLEDLDVSIQLTHPSSMATVTVDFRVDPSAMEATTADLKERIEGIAKEILLNLACRLGHDHRLRPTG